MVTLMSKIKVYEDDSFVLYIEPLNDTVHMHTYVYEWKPSTLKTMYRVFGMLELEMAKLGFKYLVTVTPNPKFAKLFGGSVIDEKVIKGIYHEVIVWELKPL